MIGLIALAVAAAAPSTAPADDDIVVNGKVSPAPARDRAEAFVKLTGIAAGDRPAARWVDPICPRALGIPANYARIVEERIRSTAADVRAPVARTPCRTNIVVSFASDGGAVARAIAARSPKQLAEVMSSERPALLQGNAPIRWWYSTQQRSRDNVAAGPGGASLMMNKGEGGVPLLPDSLASMQHYNSSIVSTQAIRALQTATVVVDVNRANGIPLRAVAAYAAMVALAELRADRPPPDSILGLFADNGRRELTDGDTALLSALYRLPLDRQARQQRGLLVRGMLTGRP